MDNGQWTIINGQWTNDNGQLEIDRQLLLCHENYRIIDYLSSIL